MEQDDGTLPGLEDIFFTDSLVDLIAAANRVAGTAGDDILVGGAGTDIINGRAGDDVLIGAAGTDVLNGGLGADVQLGGEGNDVIFVGTLDVGISGPPTIFTAPPPPETTAGERTNGGPGRDAAILIGDGVTIDGGEFGFEAFVGSTGDDAIRAASDEPAQVFAGRGDDFIEGSGRADLLVGGLGGDSMFGAAGQDTLRGEDGRDFLNGGQGDDLLEGGAGNDVLRGNTSDETFIPLSTPDVDREGGDDTLRGGEGDDFLAGASGSDLLIGGEGVDDLSGGTGNDALVGGVGSDRLFGGQDDDLLEGGVGDDTLDGGAGRDALVGGAGADMFRVEVFVAERQRDLDENDVLDFVDGEDLIELGGVQTFAEVEIVAADEGTLVVVPGATLLLRDVDADLIDEADFSLRDAVEPPDDMATGFTTGGML